MFAGWSGAAVQNAAAGKNGSAGKNCADPMRRKSNWICLGIALALAITGLTSKNWFAPSNMRWKRISPVAFRLVDEIKYKLTESERRSDYAEGIALLGGFPLADYPFVECTASASECEEYRQQDFAQFTARGERKPDIIFFVIETFRGWTGDIRVPATCEKLPNICKLAKSGLYFPNAHSVGYPSIEGFLGVLAGVWAHPQMTFLSDYPNTRMLALPEILGEAGYYRMVLTATEPSFDNLHPWFAKWFDYSEYKPENQHDVPIADRFRELYAKRPADQPLFFDWMSTTSHVPFSLPKEYGPTPSDPEEAYVRSLAYMDSAVGIVMDEVAKGPNADNTLFVLVGDHAFANNAQHRVSNFIGGVHDGYTWVPLIFAGPDIEQKIVTTPVSQVDIAPSVLSYLRLFGVSKNFVGEPLLELVPPDGLCGVDYTIAYQAAPKHRPVFAFRMGDMTMITDSVTYIANIQDSTLVSAFETVLEPTWDTSHPAEGLLGNNHYPNLSSCLNGKGLFNSLK